MSGVAKDDTNPNSPTDGTLPAAGENDGAATAAEPAASAQPADDVRPRRSAPHLRVVSDNEIEFAAAAAAAHPRIGDAIRAARENAGFTLEQVSRETRVHLSHLRAIEEMTPGLLGAPVYAKGYIKSYARFLGMDEQTTLDRYLSECAAILKDPEKLDIAPPASSKSRQLPVAVPMLGILVVALVVGGGVLFLNSGQKAPVAAAETPVAAIGVGPIAEPVAPQLRIVALKRAMLEVRSAKGDKYVHRYYNPGEFFVVRVGANFTVSAEDGSAFEWRLGEQSLGLMQEGGGAVNSQSVDQAAQRQPIVTAPPVIEPLPSDTEANALAPTTGVTGLPGATPAPAAPPKPRPRPPAQPPAASVTPATPAPSASTTPAPAAPPVRDPALDAYPDQVPATPPQ
jgi:cytoskeleton protein RodZ